MRPFSRRKQADLDPLRPLTLFAGIGYILSLWKQYWQQGLVVIVSLLAHELFKTYFALQLKRMVDSLHATGQVTNLLVIMTVLVIAFVLALATRLRGERLNAQVGTRILGQLRISMFEHLQRLPQSYYSRFASSDTIARFTTDVADVEKVVTTRLRDGLADVVILLLNVSLLFYIDWRLGLAPVINLLLMWFVVGYLMPHAVRADTALKSSEAQLTGDLRENIQAQPVIRAFGFEPQMFARFQKQLAGLEALGVRTLLLGTIVSLSARSIVLFSRVIAVGVSVLLMTSGDITIGDFVAFLYLLTLANDAIDDLNRNVLPDFIAATGSMQRVREFLAERPQVSEHADMVTPPALRRQIQLRNVFFGYSPSEYQLQDINLTLPAGKTIAVVGPSGSGKSTLLMLLMRGRTVTSGSITFDGVDIARIDHGSMAQQMGIVFQETYLFNATIRENIRMAKPSATDTEVETAAKLAEIHDVIMRLPLRYETRVGESGNPLSGGQRQRIAIARAIVRNPAILILDEATSYLDPATETAINTTLARLAQARTVITVTHRLSTIVHADQIVVLEGGRVAEVGTHEVLLERLGVYAELWRKQSGFEISSDGHVAKVRASYLGELPLFSTLDAAVLTTICDRFSTQLVNRGQVIVQQGDVGDRFYLLARGRADVLVRNVRGLDQKIAVLSDGDYFGETALVQDAPRNATIRASTDCLLLTLPKEVFLELMDELPSLQQAVEDHIARTLANRARVLDTQEEPVMESA